MWVVEICKIMLWFLGFSSTTASWPQLSGLNPCKVSGLSRDISTSIKFPPWICGSMTNHKIGYRISDWSVSHKFKEETSSWWVTWQVWYLTRILAGSPWMQQPVRVGTESTACMICCCHKCSSNNCLLWFSPWLREPKPNQLRLGTKLYISSNIKIPTNFVLMAIFARLGDLAILPFC